MGKRNKKPPPRVYHDGLIPATHDTFQSYPEVVPDDYDQVKHEKSYPEVAPPQDDPDQQPHQQHHHQDPPEDQRNQQPNQPNHPSTILTPPTAHGSHHHHHGQLSSLSNNLSALPGGLSPLSAPPHHPHHPHHHHHHHHHHPHPHPPPTGLISGDLPRTSGVHSLRQAWSDPGDPEDPRGGGVALDADRPPLWRRPVLWVALVAGAVIVVLAGILGGVASGRVGTALDEGGAGSGGGGGSSEGGGSGGGSGGEGGGGGDGSDGSGFSTASVANPTCPGSGNRNYTSTAAATMPKTFRIQCGANYPGGDGALGLQSGSIDSIASCFDACARESGCVAAVFTPGDAAECWLKEFIGVIETGGDVDGMVSGVLWQ
ncbi:uncharacterized protein B0H64DRAFT_478523 [Chaetomium fimeti]|uniref:Apple domain-containing protein n=1 Tax=Chaetomium fimeti TaxID=1854472 RepID=A0AAE0LNK0_9PEZI|nr:hypothetical protein B0H64DRAFT_478523 [Chaetomium fimeti]